uniref:Integrase catalytic domain-containing protein n=1 Tax=Tanacetum cinerariifolium TaxID=118510 RepID=A0A6L2KWL9_TANCI|nr:hypothetical protein [Tanacetum cinerariifolium]
MQLTLVAYLLPHLFTRWSANNSVFRGFFEKQKLTGPNFIDWYRQLRIVISIEDKLNYLEQPIPPAPVVPTGQHVAPEILEERKSVSSYVLKMKGYIDNLERLGHLVTLGLGKRNCPQYLAKLLKKKKNAASGAGGSGIFIIEPNTILNRSWIYDTGCGTHICNTTQGLRASRKLKPGALTLNVGIGQREAVEAIGVFYLCLTNGFINRFMNNTIQVSRNNMVCFSAILRDGIFEIDLSNSYTNECSIYAVSNKRAKLDLESALLWHCLLGHISKKHIEKLQHDGLLNSADLKAFEKCVSCMSGKMARKPCTHQVERAKDLLGLIHTAACGPFKIMSRQGANYFITFTEDFNRYGYIYLLKNKHEVFETFKVFQKEVENQLGKTIKALRSNRGGECMSQEFLDHLKDHDIIAHRTPPYTPQHNGVSERRNRTLLDMVTSMMSQTTLPKSFWDYALETATRILNMVPTKKGCEALVKRDTLTKPDKLEPRSSKCIFIGYPKETIGYSFYYPLKNKVLVAQNAKFLENSLITQEVSGSLEDLEIVHMEDTYLSIDTRLNHKKDDREINKPQSHIIPIRGSTRTRHAPDHMCLYIDAEEHELGDLSELANYKAALLDLYDIVWRIPSVEVSPCSIMYAVRCTRPDVAFAQNVTSRFQPNPEFKVSCYTDAGYLTNADDLKSQTGYVFVLNGGGVDWKSAKQSIFATSSAEAKYIATFDASKEAVWVRQFIYGLGVVPTFEKPISMYCDNTGAITIANESGITKGARHFHAKVHYLREVIEYGDVKKYGADRWQGAIRGLIAPSISDDPTHNTSYSGCNNSKISASKQKLTGPNFIDWYRQLRIVLSIKDKLNYLEQPIPPAPELLQTTRDFHSCKQEERKSVSSYVLKMKGYIDNLERLRHPVTLGLGVSLILIGLRKEFDGFVQNYNMHSLGKKINELHPMLKLHDKTLPKNNALALYAILAGHCKRNYPQYLAELLKKKKNVASDAGGSDGFINHFVNNKIQVSRNNMVYFSAIPRDGIFKIDLSNSYTNESSIYAISNKRAKLDLDSALLWHCRLGHISKKFIEKLQHDGLLNSTDLEAFEKCVSCMSGKMEVENQLGNTIKSLRSDRKGEYMSQEFLDHLKDHRIIAHRTPPYTSQHNGVSKRRNRTLLDMVEKTPYEIWHGQVPKLSYLKVWGCEAFVKQDTLTKLDKLEPRSIKCIFIGYPKETIGYSFYYTLENKVLVAQNAKFLENSLITQEYEKWLNVINVEMQSMKDNEVWVLVELPPNGKTIGSKWLFKKKTNMDGVVHTYKARLVAKGYTQTPGIDHEETFSPVADIRAIRILIAIASYYDYEIWQIDVKTAFLNGYLNEEVYIKQPEDFVNPKYPNRRCKLKRSIYGLKQASRQWIKRFYDEIKKFGFTQNRDEPCVYLKSSGSNISFLILICQLCGYKLDKGTEEKETDSQKIITRCSRVDSTYTILVAGKRCSPNPLINYVNLRELELIKVHIIDEMFHNLVSTSVLAVLKPERLKVDKARKESYKSPTRSLFDVGSSRISIFTVNTYVSLGCSGNTTRIMRRTLDINLTFHSVKRSKHNGIVS